MSSRTWTPDALSSEAKPLTGRWWRLVEAQHQVSTLKLVDDLAEQEVLEHLVEETKPAVPPECQHLHYLLATPFRYGAPYPQGSRFRRAGYTSGVFYASQAPRTAVAEMAFYRLLFFAESPDTPWPADAKEFTAFSVEIGTDRALDLTKSPLNADRAAWTDPIDYKACQDVCDVARAAHIAAIQYLSVRDPAHGCNLALLACRAFAHPEPKSRQTWRIRLSSSGAQAICEFPPDRVGFDRGSFGTDPRIGSLLWDR